MQFQHRFGFQKFCLLIHVYYCGSILIIRLLFKSSDKKFAWNLES